MKEIYLQKMRSRMRLANLSWATEQAYVASVSLFWDAAEKMPRACGQNIRALQLAMGHSSLETTMGYVHSSAMSVASPLDGALA